MPRSLEMKAALVTATNAPVRVERLVLDPPRAGEVLVRLAACGVCHSDWHLVSGATRHPLPVVPGHEGAGLVEAVGDGVTALRPGDPVVLNWAPYCGRCFYCLRGKPNLCDTFVGPVWAGVMLDGTPRLKWHGQPVYHFSALAAFAEFAVVPEVCCVPIARDVSLPIAALVGCAVTTGVGAVLYTAQVQPGDRVAVWGCGGVGLSILLGAQLAGAQQIIAVDRSAAKLALARRLGATDTVEAGSSPAEAVAAVRNLTGGRGADITFEAVGAPALQTACVEAARPGGKAVLVGLTAMGTETILPGAAVVRQEKAVLGCYYGTANPTRDFPLILDLYRGGRLNLDLLVSRTYPLEAINDAFTDMLTGDAARGIVVFD